MITISNIKEYTGNIPNTYGYISLGNIILPDNYYYTEFLYSGSLYFKAECELNNKKFDLIIYRLGNYSDKAIVLGDLPDIPGNLLLDQTELFNSLRIELKKFKPDNILGGINSPYRSCSEIDQVPVNQLSTRFSSTTQEINNPLYYDTKS